MFLINTLKHHLPSIANFVVHSRGNYTADLLTIGNSLMDVYTGNLAVLEITTQIEAYLKEKGVCEREPYIAWIRENGFQRKVVSDGSEWILLIGEDVTNYVHLHPARHSLHSMRIKATALKTAISFLIEMPQEKVDTYTLNMVRKQNGLSPIKDLSESRHLLTLIELIKSRMSGNQER